MNNKFWTRLTATAIMTTLGTTTMIGLSLQSSLASDAQEQVDQLGELLGIGTISTPESSQFQAQNVVSLGPVKTDLENQLPQSEIVTLHLHQWKYKLAVTLKIRQIPVLTFLGSKADLAAIQDRNNEIDLTQIESDAITRAQALAKRLNELSQDEKFQAEDIIVLQDQTDKSYRIKINSEELLKVDGQVILPDTTNNRAVDALQATNRLRRLMGEAAPLTAIVDPNQSTNMTGTASIQTVTSRRKGMASWYGPGFHGRLTANGERYNQHGLTAAHKTLPFGTQVRVTNLNNGRSVTVRINDRGPYAHGRVIDLSRGAASILGVVSSGVAPVQLEVLGR